jgi:hypothetical protein
LERTSPGGRIGLKAGPGYDLLGMVGGLNAGKAKESRLKDRLFGEGFILSDLSQLGAEAKQDG